MFTVAELKIIAGALILQEKSVNRLSAKDGQPEAVAIEYRKVSGEIVSLYRKVMAEFDKLTPKK